MKKWVIRIFAVAFLLVGISSTSEAATLTGWKYISGHWYYYTTKGKVTGWIVNGGNWYYLDSTGIMKTGWVYVSGKWYYLDSSGSMKTGWIVVNGKQYYLYSDGHMASNTVINGKKIDSNGAVVSSSNSSSFNYDVFQKWGDNKYHLVNTFNDYNAAVAYAKQYAHVYILDTKTGLVSYDNNSHYDVFQKFADNQEHLVNGFNDYNAAVAYAKQYAHVYILDTKTGLVVYDNNSHYDVFQKFADNQEHLVNGFNDYNAAVAYAKQYAHVYILDTKTGLVAYDNNSNYDVFQKFGDNLEHLVNGFNDYNSAVAYSKQYAHVYILDTKTGLVAYDNNSNYDVFQKFGDKLEHLVNGFNDYNSAVAYAKQYAHVYILDTQTGLVQYDNNSTYDVFQNWNNYNHLVNSFNDYNSAVAYAKQYAHAYILDTKTGLVQYDNNSNYDVFQKWGDNQYHLVNSFNDYNSAVTYAQLYANAKILDTQTGLTVYDNSPSSPPNNLDGGPDKIVWSFLKSKGLTDAAAAGVMGNLQQESSMDPNAPGGGLAQWIGPRWIALVSYAAQNGLSPLSLQAQLGFLWTEIAGGGEGVTPSGLNNRNISNATSYFCWNFEKPLKSAAMLDQRISYAQGFYNQFSGSM